MANQIKVLFGEVADNLDDFIFASQVSQAEALKYFIERFRIGRDRRSGILWWNVRDGWPQISDAVVDYYGAKKLAYHVVRRVQQNVCAMLDEPEDGAHDVVAVNDTFEPAEIDVVITRDSDVLFEKNAVVPPNAKIKLGIVPGSEKADFYRIVWRENGISYRNHYLAGPRPFEVELCRAWYVSEGIQEHENLSIY